MKGWKIPAFGIPRHLWRYANSLVYELVIYIIHQLLTAKRTSSITHTFPLLTA